MKRPPTSPFLNPRRGRTAQEVDANLCRPPEDAAYRWEYLRRGGGGYTAVPFSADHPLVFHVLTQARAGVAGEREALKMLADGVALVPFGQRSDMGKGLLYLADQVAGDGKYLFLSPFNTFDWGIGVGSRLPRNSPAFAFDARALASAAGFAFRLRDAEPFYEWVIPSDEADWIEEYDLIDWENLSHEQAVESWREARVRSAADDLRCIADVLTIEDRASALEAMLLLARSADGREIRENVVDKSEDLIPETEVDADQCPVARDVFSEGLVDGGTVLQQWRDLFRAQRDVSGLMELRPQPEVLYRGVLPLCCAAFFRNAEGEWVRPPRELCEDGVSKWSGESVPSAAVNPGIAEIKRRLLR